jgi:hypothetical protein
MQTERTRPETFADGPDAFSDPFALGTATLTGRVDVIHGVHAHPMPLAGMTVRQARLELEERMNIDPDAPATIDGVEVDEDTILQEGQVLNFVKPAGEKG